MTSTSRAEIRPLALEANGRPVRLLDRQRVHVGAQRHHRAGLAALEQADDAGVGRRRSALSRPRLARCAATSAAVRVSWSPSSGCSWMSRRQAISLLSIAAARCRISFSRSGTGDCACAGGGMDAARRTNGSKKRRRRDMGFLRGGNGNDARVSAFNRNFPDEPKFDAHGTDFRGFPEGPVRIGGRSSASRTETAFDRIRNHRAWCAPGEKQLISRIVIHCVR